MHYKIHTLDLLYQNIPETIAAYLVLGGDAPILIECGPASTLNTLKKELLRFGVTLNDIKHVLVTHIHLDHAGAAGWLAETGAQIYVHMVGMPHLINPSKLLASARQIYQDKMDLLWGKTIPVLPQRVTAVEDGQALRFGDLTIRAVDTPGHAWHHMAYQLSDVLFAGDAVGNRLNGRPFTMLPAPPPEFKLDVWLDTLNKIRRLHSARIFPTHFGEFQNGPEHLDNFEGMLHTATDFILKQADNGLSRDEIVKVYEEYELKRANDAGLSSTERQQYIMSNPLEMSVDGILRYWRKKGKL